MPGSVSSADFWFAMNTCSPPTTPSSISLASGSPYANVYETRSNRKQASRKAPLALKDTYGNPYCALIAPTSSARTTSAQTFAHRGHPR